MLTFLLVNMFEDRNFRATTTPFQLAAIAVRTSITSVIVIATAVIIIRVVSTVLAIIAAVVNAAILAGIPAGVGTRIRSAGISASA